MVNRIWGWMLLLVLALGAGAADAAHGPPVPLNGIYDSTTGKLIGIGAEGVPGVLPQTPALVSTQQSGAGATGIGVYDANGRLLKPDGTGAADTVGTMLAPYPPSAVTDMTAAVQAVIDQASALGAGLPTGRYQRIDFPNATFGISGLLLKPNVFYNFGSAKFLKLVDGTTVPTNSMLRTVDTLVNGSYYGSYDNIRIEGGVFDSNHHTCPAQQMRFENVRDFYANNLTIIQTPECTGWGAQIGGQRVRVTNSSILGGTELNQDGWHVTHGDSIILSGLYAASGDDALAIGVDKTSAGPETWDPEGAKNITVNGFVANSAKATAVKIYYGLDTTTNMPFTGGRGTINNVMVRGLVGVGGLLRNGGIYVVDTTKQFCNASLTSGATGCTLTSSYTGPTGDYWIIFDSGQVRRGTWTNGSSTITFSAISANAGATLQQIDPARIQNIDIEGNLIVGSSLNDGATSFGLFAQGVTNLRYRGTMQFNDTPNYPLTLSGAPTGGDQNGTLTVPYPGPTNATAAVTFSNGEVHTASLQNNQTAISWTPALTAGATTAVTINGFNACSVNEALKVDISFSSPAMPHGAGCGFYNSRDVDAHDGNTSGTGTSRGAWEITGVRGFKLHDQTIGDIPTNGAGIIVQGIGSGDFPNSLQAHHNNAYKLTGTIRFSTAPLTGATTFTLNTPFTGPTGLYTVTFTHSGSTSDTRTSVTLTNGSSTPSTFTALTQDADTSATFQATNTRFYIQQQGSAGFVTYASIVDNDIRGQANSSSLDQAWNTSGTTPDLFYSNGNRGFIPNSNGMGTLAIPYNANISTALLNGVGNHFTIALTGNTTMNAPTGGIAGTRITYTFTQDATGGRTVTWNSVFKFYSAPWTDGSSTANKVTSITFECDASGNWIQQAPNVYALLGPAANDAWFAIDGRVAA